MWRNAAHPLRIPVLDAALSIPRETHLHLKLPDSSQTGCKQPDPLRGRGRPLGMHLDLRGVERHRGSTVGRASSPATPRP
jgi:hypothetical protein